MTHALAQQNPIQGGRIEYDLRDMTSASSYRISAIVSLSRFWLGTLGGLLLVIAACGPSAAQGARTAHYRADPTVAFRHVVDVIADKYKIARADAGAGIIATEARWYEPDGTYEDQAHSGNGVMGQDGSILLAYEVRLVPLEGAFTVSVTPHAQQIRSGYAAPFPLKADDPAMPGWVEGKTDDLYVRINTRLKNFETAPVAPLSQPDK